MPRPTEKCTRKIFPGLLVLKVSAWFPKSEPYLCMQREILRKFKNVLKEFFSMSDQDGEEDIGRVKTPRDNQVLGIVLRKEGGGKYRVYCTDGNKRICRIPGSKKRGLWVKRDSVVLIEPWDIQGDEKGDIVESYSQAQTEWLEDRDYLDEISEFL
jgi:translation initiation factor 1A